MNYVVDAAVAIKWFVAEPLRPAALRLLSPSLALHAPDLLLAQLGEIARLKLKRGEMTPEQAQQALRQAPVFFERLHPAADIQERALQLSLRLDRPVADCFYLSCADLLKATLVTADRELASLTASFPASPIVHLSDLPAQTA
ncbi:MAG: type II toxin-antitoxin system VapC family toxin [Reyranellaceae bacterium]